MRTVWTARRQPTCSPVTPLPKLHPIGRDDQATVAVPLISMRIVGSLSASTPSCVQMVELGHRFVDHRWKAADMIRVDMHEMRPTRSSRCDRLLHVAKRSDDLFFERVRYLRIVVPAALARYLHMIADAHRLGVMQRFVQARATTKCDEERRFCMCLP